MKFFEIVYATDNEIKKAGTLGDIKGEVVGTVDSQATAMRVIAKLGDAFFYRSVECESEHEITQRVQSILKQVRAMDQRANRDHPA